jgi:hypothetical protein
MSARKSQQIVLATRPRGNPLLDPLTEDFRAGGTGAARLDPSEKKGLNKVSP